MSKNKGSPRKQVAAAAAQAGGIVDEVFDRADALVSTLAGDAGARVQGIEKQLKQGLQHTRERVDGLSGELPAGAQRALAAAAGYARRHPWQAAGLCIGAGLIAVIAASGRTSASA